MIQIGTDLFSAQQGDLVQSIQLVRKTLQGALVQPIPWVKAVGGIHTIKVVLQCLENGADILGCQNCKDLLDQFESHYESTFQ
jgi:deoxyribose-phosphate aldolase